jgi:hypothetical protein
VFITGFGAVTGVSKMRNNMYRALLVVAGLVAGQANANLITNGSFEDIPDSEVIFDNYNDLNRPKMDDFNGYAALGAGNSWAVTKSLVGWSTFYGPGIETHFNGTLGAGFNAQNGNRYLELDAHFAYAKPGDSNTGIFQQLSGLSIGQTYELSFWYRARTTKNDDNGLGIYWEANKTLLNQNNMVMPRVDYNLKDQNNLAWTQYKKNLVATSSSMVIGFGGLGNLLFTSKTDPTGTNSMDNGNGKGALLDNVSLKSVSAPATFGLFGLAALGLMLRRRKA